MSTTEEPETAFSAIFRASSSVQQLCTFFASMPGTGGEIAVAPVANKSLS